jgi:hypothetical protein
LTLSSYHSLDFKRHFPFLYRLSSWPSIISATSNVISVIFFNFLCCCPRHLLHLKQYSARLYCHSLTWLPAIRIDPFLLPYRSKITNFSRSTNNHQNEATHCISELDQKLLNLNRHVTCVPSIWKWLIAQRHIMRPIFHGF